MRIRKAELTDIRGIAKVHVDSWNTTYKGIVPDSFLETLTDQKLEERWRAILQKETMVFVTENEKGEIVGFISGGANRFKEYDTYSGEIYAIYLLKDYQKKGIGRSLVKALTQELLKQNIISMIVLVLEENPSKYFYESLGAVLIDRKDDEIGGKKLIELVYAWNDIRSI